MRDAGHRADIDNRRVRMLRELRVRQTAHLERGEHVLLENLTVFVAAIVQRGQRLIAAGVVDQQRQRRAKVGNPVEHGQALFGLGQVRAEGQHLDLGEIVGQLDHHLFEIIRIARPPAAGWHPTQPTRARQRNQCPCWHR